MTTDSRGLCRITRRFDAAPERVFDAWLDPETAGRFLFATPDGEMVRVEIEPRVAGRYSIVERRDGEDVEHTGEYLEIERPRRLAWTLRVPKYSEETSRVTIEIAAGSQPADAGCELTLTHETRPEWAGEAEEGWSLVLDGLDAVLR